MTKTKALVMVAALLAASMAPWSRAVAQDAPSAASNETPAEAAPAQAADAQAQAEEVVEPTEPAAPAFSQEQLDQMLAPIALYPDSLLMQLMMASTYPLEIVEAERWRKKNASLKDAALEKALESEDWDPSVKAMTLFPDVLTRMSENLDWTQDLGDAFLSQQSQVLDTIQALRKQANDAGNLKSNEQQTVVVNNETKVIEIEPAKPEVVYVPQYNSAAVYGTPPPAAPYYPTANTYTGSDMLMTGALSFGAGLLIGNLIWDDDSDCDWDNHHVYGGYGNNNDINIDVNGDVNIGNQVGGGNRKPQQWQHNPAHRGGVNYRDPKTRQTYANKAGARPALDSKAARGYKPSTLGSGGGTATARPSVQPAKIGGGVPSKGSAQPKIGGATAGKAQAKRPSTGSSVGATAKKPAPTQAAQKRPSSGSSIGSAGGNRPTAVGGLGGGSATRAASARGASSRGVSGSAGSRSGAGAARGGGGGRRR